MPDKPRIVFFGTPEFAVPSLTLLLEHGFDVVAAYTQPDKPVGRKRVLVPSAVNQLAFKNSLPIVQPESLKDDDAFDLFATFAPDLCIVVAYGKLIPKRYLDVPRFGFLNVHPSLLPVWRGPSPIQAVILNGDEKTGVSIMLLDDEMDHGPLLAQTTISLDHTEYYSDLSGRLARIGADLLVDATTKHLLDGIQPYDQDHEAATFSEKASRHNARIDWSRPAVEIERQVRAYAGEPTAWTTWQDKSMNILRARAHKHQQPQTKPGTILGYDDAFLVDTPDGTLELESLQPAGKNPMTPRIFANGHRDFLGSRFT